MAAGTTTAGGTGSGNGSASNAFGTPFDRVIGEVDRILGFVPREAIELVAAALVLLAGYYGSKFAVRIAGRTVARRFERPSVTRTVLRLIRLVVLLFTLVTAGRIVGLGGTDILLSVTVFSAVTGVILAPIVGSIINGLFILADQPYEIGDMIELADRGQRGFVEDITLRYTKMFTLDNTFIVIPNSTIRDRDVINYSAEDERTRLTINLLFTYESDIDRAREVSERAARDVDVVITGGPDIRIGSARYPAAPRCYVDQFADSGILLTLRYWVKQPYKLLTARSLVQERLERVVRNEPDLEFAYPHSHLVFDETSGDASVDVSHPRSDVRDLLGGSPRPGGESSDVLKGDGSRGTDTPDR